MADTRVLLLTDLVDSTKIADTLGDEVAATLWADHDRLARDLLRVRNGREIDKSDGFLLLFSSVDDAIAYARDYHEGLASLSVPLVARAGMHKGPVTLRENSGADVALGAKPVEVEGLAKAVAARVLAVAQVGERYSRLTRLVICPRRASCRTATGE